MQQFAIDVVFPLYPHGLALDPSDTRGVAWNLTPPVGSYARRSRDAVEVVMAYLSRSFLP